jgi:hypothetical protein
MFFSSPKRLEGLSRPTQPPVQEVAGSCPGLKRTGAVKMITLLQLVCSLRMIGVKPLLPYTSLRRGQGIRS